MKVFFAILAYVFFSLLFLGILIAFFTIQCFGVIEFERVLFHLYAPLKGSPLDFLELTYPYVLVFLVLLLLIPFFRANRKLLVFSISFCFVLNCFLWNYAFAITDWLRSKALSSKFIEQHYVDPRNVLLTFPTKKRNLIFILAESLETSFLDVSAGGLMNKNIIPELFKIAKNNLYFSHSSQMEGAVVFSNSGWTIAGMVSETAGIPLKTYGSSFYDGGNEMDSIVSFLPGACSLGDILEKYGYNNVFIAGSDTTFAGKKSYMKQHGNYEIYDKEKIEAEKGKYIPIVHDRIIADSELYPMAKSKIMEIAKQKKPFHVMLLTGNTHMRGYNDRNCTLLESNSYIENSYYCADQQLRDFIQWLSKQPFYDNTTVVVVGDHHNMLSWDHILSDVKRDVYQANMKNREKRKVYNVFINTPYQPIRALNRKFSTLDIFPTTLASIGVKIEGNRLALGTNLFSDEKTLLEQYDYDYIEQEFKKRSGFYLKKLW